MLSIGYDDNFLAIQKVMGREKIWNKIILRLDRDCIFRKTARWRHLCVIARKSEHDAIYSRQMKGGFWVT